MFSSNMFTTKGSINPQSNLTSMQSTVTSSIEILTTSAAMSKIQGTSNERELTTASLIPKDVGCIKELICQNGVKIRIEWSPRTGINAYLSSSKGCSASIRPENLPRTFHQIKCSRGFYQFMKGLSVRLIELDNRELKITAFHPLRGGMMENHSHLEGAREAFEMIALRYKKTLPSPDYNIKKFTKWLKNSDIFCGEPAGTDRQGLIHAVLQHVTGRYSGEPFSETPELSQEISAISASSSESSDDITLRHTLDFIKNRDGLEIRVTLIQANQKGQPVKISQIGNETAYPVVIWKREDEYLALTTTDYHKPVEEGLPSPNEEEAFSPDPDLPPNASTTVDLPSTEEKINPIEEAIDQLRTHLRDLKNPFVRQSIQNSLREMGSFRPREGIASFFESIIFILPEESQECVRALNEAITKQARGLHSEFDLLGEIKKLKALGEEQMPREQGWKELNMLLTLDEVKKLPNKAIEMVMSFISKGDLPHLLDYLPEELRRTGANLTELDYKLSRLEDRMSLNSLIRLIIRRKPALSPPLIWYRSSPDSLKGKVLSLTNPKTRENHTGVILDCDRLNETWIFILMDKSKVEIHLPSNNISLSKFHNIELCEALIEESNQVGLAHSNKIELISSDTKKTLINPGKYTISTQCHRIPPKEHKRKKDKRTSSSRNEEIQTFQLEVNLNGGKNQGNYVIHMIFSEDPPKLKNLVEVKLVDLSQPLSGQVLTPSQFRDSYFIKTLNKITLSGIDTLENTKYLQFQEEDPDTIKPYYLKIVKEKELRLRMKLLNDHHIEFLEYLLDDLVFNHLRNISPIRGLKIPDDFKRLLNEIVQIYHEKLDKFDVSAESVLMQIVIDANYARLIDRTQSVLVGKAIQLIHEAYAQISKIRDNDVILFMGNTGAGKSTGINFFLDAPLEEFQNKAGDKAVKIRDGITNPEKYPKIGQSLGTSETLYGQGYEVPWLRIDQERTKFFVDCPGFNDTRGSDYELCAALSLDQIVNACHSITCIVLVVPMQAFLVDRANPVIDLVESIKEIFPGAFANTSREALPIHMLITKQSSDEEENFNHRISTLLLEAQDQLKKSASDHEASETEIIAHQRRAETWEVIAEMVKVDLERISAQSVENIRVRNTLSFLNIADTLQSRELPIWYNRSKFFFSNDLIKRSYVPRMQSLDLKEKLGRYVQNFAHTWCEGVIRQYFETIPKMILRLERLIMENTLHQAFLTQHQELNRVNLAKVEEFKAANEELLIELEAINIDTIERKSDLYTDLEEKVIASNQRSLSIVQREIQDMQRLIGDDQGTLEEAERNLQSIVEEIERYGAMIIEKRNQIQRLSEGQRETLLREFACQPQDFLTVNSIEYRRKWLPNFVFKTLDAPNRGIDRIEKISAEESVQANQFRGVLRHWVEVTNDYQLILDENIRVSKSILERMKFWNWSNRSFGSGSRIARVIGNEVTLNLAETIENGNRTIYCFETNWTASTNLPSFRIFHSQPNQIYNAGSISNREAEINDLNEFLTQEQRDRQRHQSTIDRIRESLNQSNQRLVELQQEESFLKGRLSDGLSAWRNEVKQNIQILKVYQTNYYKELTRTEDDFREIENNLKNYETERHQLKKRKRNLAIIVSTQIEAASMVRGFIDAILDPQRTEFAEIKALSGMVGDCKKFMQSFDTGWEAMRAECHKDLFSNHQKDLSLLFSFSSHAASSSSSSSSSHATNSSSSSPTPSSYAASSSSSSSKPWQVQIRSFSDSDIE